MTVIAAAAFEPAVLSLLDGSGASGHTVTRASGFGHHGASRVGLVSDGNVRVEVLLGEAPARALLERVTSRFAGWQVVAFMVDVEAVPAEHFVQPQGAPSTGSTGDVQRPA